MLYDNLEDKLESLKDSLLVQKSITDYFAQMTTSFYTTSMLFTSLHYAWYGYAAAFVCISTTVYVICILTE